MWISRLELQNFKSYIHQVFNFPCPANGKHVIVIGGRNGYGKTTLLEALYLCLYGKDAMPHLTRAGLSSEKGYPSFLERALNGHALKMDRDLMSVTVRIIHQNNEGIQIKRSWFFKPSGDWTAREEIMLQTIKNGQPDRILNPESIREQLEREFIPAHIAPFFFFDGEEVKKLADQDRVEQVKQGMEGLLGVTLLRALEQTLIQFQITQKPEKSSNLTPNRIAELAETLQRREAEQLDLKEKRSQLETDLKIAKERRQDLMNRTMALGGGSGDIANVKEIMEEKGALKQEREKNEANLAKMLADKLPFHLMRQDLRDDLITQWMSELELGRWEARRASMDPDRQRFLENFFAINDPPIDPELNAAQEAAIRQRMELAWQGLFFPVPADCAEQVIHTWIHDEKRAEAVKLFNKIRIGGQTILQTADQILRLREREHELDQRLTRLEGIDRDGTLAQIKNALIEVNQQIEQKEHELGGIDRQMTALKETITQDRATYEREHEKLIQSSPALSSIAKAERVRLLISDLIPRLYTLKTQRLSESMTRVFGKLAHTPWFDRIEVNEMGRSTLFSKDGNEVSFDRSAGENQLFVTALLAGLAEVSGIQAPLVVDTPLGRLDIKHRENILNFWLSNGARQVILLSQDAEIGPDLMKRLQPAIAKTWLLNHEVIGQGVGKTVAYEDQYFQFEAMPA